MLASLRWGIAIMVIVIVLLMLLMVVLVTTDVVFASQATTDSDNSRPNILFIMTDQQRFDAIRRVQEELPRYDDHTKIRTPNLDKLSRRGAYFQNAYCQSSVCAPARTTLRTGCTVERTGIQTNDLAKMYNQFPHFQQCVSELDGIDQILTRLGYVSEYYGKWHIPDSLNGDTIQYNDYNYETNEFQLSESSSWTSMLRRYLDYFETTGEISKEYTNGTQRDTYTRFPYTPIQVDARYGYPTNTPLNEENGFESHQTSQPNVAGRYSLSSNYTPSYFNGDIAVKALQRLLTNNNNDDNANHPFFLTVSFHHPHAPMVAAVEHLQYYWNNRDTLFVTPSITDTLENSAYSSWSDKMPIYSNAEAVQEWTAVYYALVEEIDDWVGRLIDELDVSGQSDNTLIIFTSDHGEMLGAHGMREKNKFYEEAAKVPLFIAFDGVIPPGTVVESPVSHLDIVATILDYIGAPSEDSSDGKTLRPLIEDGARDPTLGYDHDYIVAEWDFRMPISGAYSEELEFDRSIDARPSLLIRKGPYKLMMQKLASSRKLDMMYNLEDDPYEMNNLLGRNSQQATTATIGKAEHLRCLLVEWMNRMDGGDQQYYSDPIANLGEGRGDIYELQERQSWPAIDFWISDTSIHINGSGGELDDGQWLLRSTYLYLGSRVDPAANGEGSNDNNIPIASFSLVGPYAEYFHLAKQQVSLVPGKCQRVQIVFFSIEIEFRRRRTSYEASLIVSRDDHPDVVIPITVDE